MKKLILGFCIVSTFFHCGQSNHHSAESSSSVSEEPMDEFISSSAAVVAKKDSVRKFIRTADLKFRVKNVYQASSDIEELTRENDGFVVLSNLTSEVENVETVIVSSDSSLETTYFKVVNELTLRVPNTKLDETLIEISKFIDYLDYRNIKAQDVALNLLANDLTQSRTSKNVKRVSTATDKNGKKLETTRVEETIYSRGSEADRAKIANLELHDQINYSTINLNIYQRSSVKRVLLPNETNIAAYEPGFWSKMSDSLKVGLNVFELFIISITKLWGFVLFALIGFFIFKQIRKNKTK